MSDDLLGCNQYHLDLAHAHIRLGKALTAQQAEALVLICPAGLYQQDVAGQLSFDYAGCLECGACRVIVGASAFDEWHYPAGALGIEYQFG